MLRDGIHRRTTRTHGIDGYTRLGSGPEPIEENLQTLRELIPTRAELQHIPEILLEFGHAPERILKAAEEREADMIILGARAHAEIGSTHLPWSAAHHVIAQAHCPVLTIRE